MFVTTYALVLVAYIVPGALGVMTALVVAAFAVAIALGSRAITLPDSPEESTDPPADDALTPADWISLATAGVVVSWLGGAFLAQATLPVVSSDMASWDLPMIGRWMDSGSMWGVNEFLPTFSHGSYPHNGDVAIVSFMLPWSSDFLIRVPGLIGLGFLGLAVFSAARELGAPRWASISAPALVCSVPILGISAINYVMPDALTVAAFACCAYFLVRQARTGGVGDMILAGTALGLGLGGKWYGVTTAAVLAAVWLLVCRRAVSAPGGLIAGAARFLVPAGVFGGFWFLRNWVSYGNPVFPVDVSVLGIDIFDSPPDPTREIFGDSIVDRIADFGDLAPTLFDAFGAASVAILLAAAYVLVRGVGEPRRSVAAIGLTTLACLAVYVITPYTAGPEGVTDLLFADSRYLVPGLAFGAVALAVAAGSVRTLALPAAAVTAGLTVWTLGSSVALEGPYVAAVGAAVIVAFLASRTDVSIRATGAAAAVAAVAFVIYAADRFDRNLGGGSDALLAGLATGDQARRIGLAGVWTAGAPPVRPAFGPEFDNEVEYIGPVIDGALERYETEDEWRERVETDGFELLLVGRLEATYDDALGWSENLDAPLVAESDRFLLFDLGP